LVCGAVGEEDDVVVPIGLGVCVESRLELAFAKSDTVADVRAARRCVAVDCRPQNGSVRAEVVVCIGEAIVQSGQRHLMWCEIVV
jgi:hypothetical protein